MAATTSPDALSALKLDALKQLATERGIKGVYKMRKDDLVAALSAAPAAPTQAKTRQTKPDAAKASDHGKRPVLDLPAPKRTVAEPSESASHPVAHRAESAADQPAAGVESRPYDASHEKTYEPRRNSRRSARRESGPVRAFPAEQYASSEPEPRPEVRPDSRFEGEAELDREERLARLADAVATARLAAENSASEQGSRAYSGTREEPYRSNRRSYTASREQRDTRETREPRESRESRDYREPRESREARETREPRDAREPREPREYREPRESREYREPREPRELVDGIEQAGEMGGDKPETQEAGSRYERSEHRTSRDRYEDERRTRSRERGRDRYDRKQRRGLEGPTDQIEITDEDELIPVAGVLDVLDNHAFVRTSGYLPGPNDVYVSLNQVKRNGLRRGDAIVGAIKAPREGDTQLPSRNKYSALVRVDSVNGLSVEEAMKRPEFAKLTPLYPQERLRLETAGGANKLSSRMIDIIAPIGKGQRGLLVSPPKAGKTLMMQQIANSITTNNPEVHLMVVLVDERPEEVTDFQRSVKGEVISSTFDRHASDHTTVAELAIERAKRLVELGQDVVILLDGITRLSRAYNLAAPASGRILSGGVDAAALYPPKKFFGAARNIEGGGSLTILATALVETGSKMDEVIFEEFKGTGNMELRLSRSLAEKRIYPAINVNASSTRREEILLSKEELAIVYKLRRLLGALDEQQATELLLNKLKSTGTNLEFLMQVQKTTPGALADMVED